MRAPIDELRSRPLAPGGPSRETISPVIEPIGPATEPFTPCIEVFGPSGEAIGRAIERISPAIEGIGRPIEVRSRTIEMARRRIEPGRPRVEPIGGPIAWIPRDVEDLRAVHEAREPVVEAQRANGSTMASLHEGIGERHERVGRMIESIRPIVEGIRPIVEAVRRIHEVTRPIIEVPSAIGDPDGADANLPTAFTNPVRRDVSLLGPMIGLVRSIIDPIDGAEGGLPLRLGMSCASSSAIGPIASRRRAFSRRASSARTRSRRGATAPVRTVRHEILPGERSAGPYVRLRFMKGRGGTWTRPARRRSRSRSRGPCGLPIATCA